jgi:hypothetical protein
LAFQLQAIEHGKTGARHLLDMAWPVAIFTAKEIQYASYTPC